MDATRGRAGPHRVVVVGAGFGGLAAVGGLKGAPVAVTLVDARNHHIFQPLLYQVATASLPSPEVAWPIRMLVSRRRDVETVLATVTGVEPDARRVRLADGSALPYDTLVLATGARDSYFGHDDWRAVAPGLKTIEDATRIRRSLLLAFERAELEPSPAERAALLTFVVVGGGSTGVEMAGTIAELARDTLPRDFRAIDTRQARVVLIEAGPRLLAGYPDDLSDYARVSLERIGVEVRLGQPVSSVADEGVTVAGEALPARTVIWAAGVRASAASEWLGAPADKTGRIRVGPDLTVPGHPEIFALGDTVAVAGPDGKPVPGIAPAAKQEGRYAARVIRERLDHNPPPPPFRYRHQGSLAQIGKRRAVADFGFVRLKGSLAWWLWGIAHIYFLIGFRSRVGVIVNWLWIYARNQRGARLITPGPERPEARPAE